MYTEALNIADYADSEDICIPAGLLEKLYANRAAAYLNIVPVSRGGLSKQLPLDTRQAAQKSNRLPVNCARLHYCAFSGKCISVPNFTDYLREREKMNETQLLITRSCIPPPENIFSGTSFPKLRVKWIDDEESSPFVQSVSNLCLFFFILRDCTTKH